MILINQGNFFGKNILNNFNDAQKLKFIHHTPRENQFLTFGILPLHWLIEIWMRIFHFSKSTYTTTNKQKVLAWHNTSTRLIRAATAKDAWLILFWFLRQFYVIKRQIAAESTFFKFFSIIWKPSQAFYAVAATVALCSPKG